MAQVTAVELRSVNKQFPDMGYKALDEVNLAIEEGEFVTILGSSGCGKTTLIKTVNRIYEPDSGEVFLFGKNVLSEDPVQLRRRIGYVIQQIGLFPHMTVRDNIATIPQILKWDKARIDDEVDRMLSLVRLDPEEFRGRYPAQLSGGQQQRIGLARALICDPKVMLLDEPFGAIDAINREKLQRELKGIHSESKKTYLFVTHDIQEAFRLGTKVVIMNRGRILQYAPPEEILSHPADSFVEELVHTADAVQDYVEGGEGI
ncbi:MAG: ABC transporter ATP-binding protein [Lachnospiraceae bacterium]|nr:ABC transporter ATP-binding protein [Lachnospiraceae bacterium]